MQKIKVNDEVMILAGKDRGKTGKIKSINWKKRRVFVDGINVAQKAVRASQEKPEGGYLAVECPLDISNVAVLSPQSQAPTRVRIEKRDGKRVRVAVKCKTVLP